MAEFDEQIKNRKKHEDELLTEAFQDISKAVNHRKIGDSFYENGRDMKDAVSQLLRYFDVREREVPKELTTLEERLDYLLSSSGIFFREVHLEEGWHRDAMGVMMGTMKEDGAVITILPGEGGGYLYVNPHTGRKKWITKKEEEKIHCDAYCFYRPLPMRKLRVYDIWRYMKDCLTTWDLLNFCTAAGIISAVGLLLPRLNRLLTGTVVSYGNTRLLLAVMIFMTCVTIDRKSVV